MKARRMRVEIREAAKEGRRMLVGTSLYRPIMQDAGELPPYPLDLSHSLHDGTYADFDRDGIPYRVFRDAGTRYTPTRVAGYALAQWNEYVRTGDKDALKAFLRQAEWFCSNAKHHEDGTVWTYDFDWGSGLEAPWVSGMAQGEALSVLARAFLVTGDRAYRKIGIRAVGILTVPVEAGGVLTEYAPGEPCIEEYPRRTGPQTHVLNGFIYALFGVLDYMTLFGDDSVGPFLEHCVDSLSRNLQRYDLGYWSAYELAADAVNPSAWRYHDLHIAQLEALHALTGRQEFLGTATCWKGYQARLHNRMRAFVAKARYRMAHHAMR